MGMIPLSSANIPIIAIGSLYIGSNVSTPTELVIGANGKVLTSNGTTPVWSDITTTSWSSITGKPTFATVATSGLFSDLLSKPTTLSGYGISDGQPLDGDLTAIAALAGTSGFLKKTGTNTWTLDTSTYITSSQVITYASTASTSSLALDLSNQQSLYLISALAANLTLTTSNRSAGKVYGVRIKDNGTARNLTFPAWTWMRPAPTSTIAGKWIVVTIECYGVNDTDIIADWTTEDANVYTTYGRSLLTGADAAATRTLLGLAAIAASGSAADLTGALADARLSANVPLLNAGAAFTVAQTIDRGTGALPTSVNASAQMLRFAQADGIKPAGLEANTWSGAVSGGGMGLYGVAAAGTRAAPAATIDGTTFFAMGGFGHNGSAYTAQSVLVRLMADGTWSAGNAGTKFIISITDNGSTSRYDLAIFQRGALGLKVAPTAGNGLIQLASGTTKANGLLLGDVPVYRFQSYGLAIDTNSSGGHQVRIYDDSINPTIAIRAADNVYAQLLFRTYNGTTEDDRFRARADGSGLLWQTWNGSTWTDMLKVTTTGNLAFYGVAGSTRQTAAAAATDAATTQTLANSLRTILINLGLAQ